MITCPAAIMRVMKAPQKQFRNRVHLVLFVPRDDASTKAVPKRRRGRKSHVGDGRVGVVPFKLFREQQVLVKRN